MCALFVNFSTKFKHVRKAYKHIMPTDEPYTENRLKFHLTLKRKVCISTLKVLNLFCDSELASGDVLLYVFINILEDSHFGCLQLTKHMAKLKAGIWRRCFYQILTLNIHELVYIFLMENRLCMWSLTFFFGRCRILSLFFFFLVIYVNACNNFLFLVIFLGCSIESTWF